MKKQYAISIWVLCWAGAAFPAYPKNPSIVVDGRLDEAVWRSLPPERLTPSEAGVPSETGGEIRAIVIGRFLYIGARLPEPTGRITARLIGRNPSWEDEDLLRILCGSDIGYTDRILQINPWGAYSVEKALHVTSHFLDVYPYSQENPASQVIVKGGAKPRGEMSALGGYFAMSPIRDFRASPPKSRHSMTATHWRSWRGASSPASR